jgi:simple sugar transport system ATP-binding protein
LSKPGAKSWCTITGGFDGAETILTIDGLRKNFGATPALAGVDLSVAAGRILALMGANGAGKSTLVNVLSGVYAPDAGHMRLRGRPFAPASPADAARAGIATVHQSTQLAGTPGLTVADALMLDRMVSADAPLFLSRRSVRRAAAALAAKAGFDLPLDRDFAEIGPADRQMLAIARAVSREAAVLILDEPTASLSMREAERLFNVLEGLRAQGLAIIYISHRSGDIARLADRAVVLRGGRVAADLPRPVDLSAAMTAMIGRPLAAVAAPRRAEGEVVLQVRGVLLQAGGPPLDLTLRAGEVVALTGPLGAGKSRLLAAIGGAAPIAGGAMALCGRPYRPRSPREAIAAGVVLAGPDRHRSSFVPSDWPGGSVAETISLPHLRRWFPAGFLFGNRERHAATDAIARLRIRAAGPRARLASLSGGNQQKVVLARWQAEPARVLLLDEPFQGVDVGARADLVAALRADSATAILVATSDPEEAMQLADRIFVMDGQRLIPWSQPDRFAA